jgi:hypothetical protein
MSDPRVRTTEFTVVYRHYFRGWTRPGEDDQIFVASLPWDGERPPILELRALVADSLNLDWENRGRLDFDFFDVSHETDAWGDAEAECDAWLAREHLSGYSPEAWWAARAFMKARGFDWPEKENNHEQK